MQKAGIEKVKPVRPQTPAEVARAEKKQFKQSVIKTLTDWLKSCADLCGTYGVTKGVLTVSILPPKNRRNRQKQKLNTTQLRSIERFFDFLIGNHGITLIGQIINEHRAKFTINLFPVNA